MDANGVNMVAIGLEQLGAQDFIDGNFFDGGVCVCVCVCARTYHNNIIIKNLSKFILCIIYIVHPN